MLLVMFSRPASQPAGHSLWQLALMLDIGYKHWVSILFMPAMHIGTTDFSHFIPPSVTLILVGNHKNCAKRNLVALFFQAISIKLNGVLKQLTLKFLCTVFSKISVIKGLSCCFSDCLKKLKQCHVFRHFRTLREM